MQNIQRKDTGQLEAVDDRVCRANVEWRCEITLLSSPLCLPKHGLFLSFKRAIVCWGSFSFCFLHCRFPFWGDFLFWLLSAVPDRPLLDTMAKISLSHPLEHTYYQSLRQLWVSSHWSMSLTNCQRLDRSKMVSTIYLPENQVVSSLITSTRNSIFHLEMSCRKASIRWRFLN